MDNKKPFYVVCWSGGKDSTATIVLAHELGLPIDLIIINLMWFDKSREIYAEYPEVIEWIFNYAIPLFKSWGYKVKVLESKKDYTYWFYHKIEKTSKPDRVGKIAGWLLCGRCCMNREKTRPIQSYLKTLGTNCIQYVGIAADEQERLERIHDKGHISLLEQQGIIEQQTYDILKPYNLLSPTYNFSDRGGCWFCPNAKIKELAYLKQNHPDLWNELIIFDKAPNKIQNDFKRGKTFTEIATAVENYITNPPPEQLTLFD